MDFKKLSNENQKFLETLIGAELDIAIEDLDNELNHKKSISGTIDLSNKVIQIYHFRNEIYNNLHHQLVEVSNECYEFILEITKTYVDDKCGIEYVELLKAL